MRRVTQFILLGLLFSPLLPARSHAWTEIDDYCESLNDKLADVTPFVFEGPEPWSEADDIDPADPPSVYARVYTVGPQIRRVFVRVTDTEDGWREDIVYCYKPGGDLAKRVRTVQSPVSNISLEIVTYYGNGEVLKQRSRRRSLARGKQDSSQFVDPGAPVFWTTDDLPFSELMDLWRGLT